MNEQEINQTSPLSIEELLILFKRGRMIHRGSISIFGDTIGRPGDGIWTLTNIEEIGGDLILTFGETEIICIQEPANIGYNKTSLRVNNCRKIEWKTRIKHLFYVMEEGLLSTYDHEGTHIFNTNANQPALVFYTW